MFVLEIVVSLSLIVTLLFSSNSLMTKMSLALKNDLRRQIILCHKLRKETKIFYDYWSKKRYRPHDK